ncbi:MAG: AsmA family protein [Thermoanaerobaculia bacterium]
MKIRKRTAVATAVAAAFFFLAVLFLSRDDWNWARPIARWSAKRILDRELTIDGDLRVHLGRRTGIVAHGLRFGNASWAATPEMLTAERVTATVRLFPLLRGKIRLDRLDVESARLALERDSSGTGNWSFGSPEDSGGSGFQIPEEISLRDFSLALADRERPRGFALQVDDLTSKARGPARTLAGHGVYQDEPFALRAAFYGLPGAAPGRTPAIVKARVGATEASALGWLGDGSESRLFSVALEVHGKSLDDVWRMSGFPLPHSPPFAIAGRLSYGGDAVHLERFAGTLGHSDIDGSLTVHLPDKRRMAIDADLHSRAIDLDDIEGFWGRPPVEESGKQPAAPPGSPQSIFPDLRFDLAKLRVADARIQFAADKVQGKSVLDHVHLNAVLDDGVLRLKPLSIGMSSGEMQTNAEIDARSDEPQLRGDVVLSRVRLDELLARSGVSESAGGTFGGRAEITSHGASLRVLASHLDGEVGTVLQNGWISDPLLELVALHLGGYIGAKLGKNEPGPIRCLVGVFDARQGVMTARDLLLDTSHVRIEGEGKIDLAKETVDLELVQHSKHLTIGALKTPIEISGPLATRTARLKAGPLIARGGVAVALGAAINPFAALLALVDLGRADKPGACAEALAEYRPIAAEVTAARSAAAKAATGKSADPRSATPP